MSHVILNFRCNETLQYSSLVLSCLGSWRIAEGNESSVVLIDYRFPRCFVCLGSSCGPPGQRPPGVTTSLRFVCWYGVAHPFLKWNIQCSWQHNTANVSKFKNICWAFWVYYFCSKQKHQTSTLTLIREEAWSDDGHLIYPNNCCITL